MNDAKEILDIRVTLELPNIVVEIEHERFSVLIDGSKDPLAWLVRILENFIAAHCRVIENVSPPNTVKHAILFGQSLNIERLATRRELIRTRLLRQAYHRQENPPPPTPIPQPIPKAVYDQVH